MGLNVFLLYMVYGAYYTEGLCTQYLGSWDLGNSNYRTGFR